MLIKQHNQKVPLFTKANLPLIKKELIVFNYFILFLFLQFFLGKMAVFCDKHFQTHFVPKLLDIYARLDKRKEQ